MMRGGKFIGLKPFILGVLFGYAMQFWFDYYVFKLKKRDDEKQQLESIYTTLISVQQEMQGIKSMLVMRNITPSEDQIDRPLRQTSSDEDVFYDTTERIEQELSSPAVDFAMLIEQVDQMFEEEDKFDRLKVYQFLMQYYDDYNSDCDYLWRLSKATYFISKTNEYLQDKERRKKVLFEAFDYARRALTLNADNGDCHKWFAITIGATSDFVGIKDRIANGKLFKEHLDIAMAIKTDDPTLLHMAGRFVIEFLSLSWVERKVAAALMGSLPDVSYETALKYFYQAYHLKPQWKENLYYIAKAHIDSGESSEARTYVDMALAIPSNTLEDETIDRRLEQFRDIL